MNVLDFLYYSLYRVFKLVKRVGEKDENLTSSFFALLLSINILSIFLIFKLIISLNWINQHLLKGSFFIVFFILYFICKNYFLKKENYLRIVSFYESKYKRRNNQMAIIGVLYALITFLCFIALAMWLSRI
ncbi:MAG: hypothetical protein KatS3mg028_0615 [Bacteroidia bacterium]|nr:MAG: hypothetical protein KatS3mg028_0615 [Bacteroidia bacterium]